MAIKLQSSVLFVKDIKASRHFYEDLLQQNVALDFGPNIGFESGFAIWQVDHAYQTIFGLPSDEQGKLGRKNFELYFESADLDAVWSRVSSAGVPVIHPVREQPWGQRVFRIYDPDRHIVEIGEPMPAVVVRFLSQGLSPDQVAERTSMPLEIVKQIGSIKP